MTSAALTSTLNRTSGVLARRLTMTNRRPLPGGLWSGTMAAALVAEVVAEIAESGDPVASPNAHDLAIASTAEPALADA